MPGSHKFELKFVTDIENIVKDFQKVMGQLQQMAQQMRIQVGVDFIGPNGPVGGGPGGGGNQGLNVTSSPGTTMRGASGGVRDIFGRPLSPGGVPNDPSDDRSTYQRFRQDDPALQLLLAQRATREREQHITLMTGGRSGSEFLSERMRELSHASDPESRATLAALTKFKAELDATSTIMARLRRDRQEALEAGDLSRASKAQSEIEERTRIKEQMVQNAGALGGGAPPSWLGPLLAGVTAAGVIAALPKITAWISSSSLAAVSQGAPVGKLDARLAHASFQTGEGLTMLDQGILANAARAGDFADLVSPINPMTYVHGAKQLFAAPFGFKIQSPAVAAAAKNASAYLDKALETQAVQVEAINQAFGRAGGRRGLGQQLGLSQSVMSGMSAGTFIPESLAYGFSEADTLSALSSGFGMNMGGAAGGDITGGINSQKAEGLRRMMSIMPSMKFRARATGMDLGDVMRQTGGLMTAGGSEELANKEQEEIVTRGVQRGVIGAGLVKQTDALVTLAQQAAGVGAVSTGGFNRIFDAATSVAGPNLGTDAGRSVAEMIRGERTSRSGLQGLVNRLTADRTIRQMFPHLSPAVRDQAIRALSFHDPSEWGSPEVWNQVSKAIQAGLPTTHSENLTNTEFDLLRGSPRVQQDLIANLQTQGEAYQKQLFGVFGGGNEMMGRLMMPGPATQSVLRQEIGNIIAAGGGNMNAQQVSDQLQRQFGVNIKDPTVQAEVADEVKNALLANRGMEALDRIISRLSASSGTLDIVATALGNIAKNGPGAATALKDAATALDRAANPANRVNTSSGVRVEAD